MRAIKQPIYPFAQKITSQEDLAPNPFKYSYYETAANQNFRELRSLSKNKKKLRYHLFKNKNLVTENHFYSPNRPEQTKTYSSYVHLLPHQALQPKPSLRVVSQDKLPTKKPLRKEPQFDQAQTQAQADRKEKKQFKLIHQIKKQKAKKIEQKFMAEQEHSDIYRQKVGHIEAKGAKMEIFAQELHDILENPSEHKEKGMEFVSSGVSKVLENQTKVIPQTSLHMDSPLEYGQCQDPIKQQSFHEVPRNIEESYRQPDLNRSCLKAQQILRQRKNSNSSMDISMRLSKIRQEMNVSLALQSINNTKTNMSQLFKDILQSNKGKGKKTGTIDKLRIHIRILQTLSHFVFDSTKFDIVTQQWQQLNFLIYKKYYIERIKILNFIKKYPMKNPFFIYNAEISSKEIIDFMKTEEGHQFKAEIVKETSDIKTRLSTFYSHFDKSKVGEKINLFEYDNFSHWIIEQLWAELILTEYNTSHEREVIDTRLCRILQLIFLISQLNGKYEFPFEQAESAIKGKSYGNYIREGKQIFQKYILYKSP